MELLTRVLFTPVAHAGHDELDLVFPIDRGRQAVKVFGMRGSVIAPSEAIGVSFWVFGLTKNPKNYRTNSVEFWHDESSFAVMQQAYIYRLDGAAGGSWLTKIDEGLDLQGLLLPSRIMGVWFNNLQASRRFRLEVNYEVVTITKTAALYLDDIYNKG